MTFWIMLTEPTNEEIIDLGCIFRAKTYMETEYFLTGERIFLWDVWGDPEDDSPAHTAANFFPPSDRDYSWYEIVDYEIASYEITQRSPTGNPRIITVHATVTINSGYSDEDEEAPPYTEEREIFCYMEFDAETGTWTVEEAEE